MGKYDFGLDLYDDNTISWIAVGVHANSYVLEFGPANGRLTRFLKTEKNCTVDIVEIDEESGTEAAQYAHLSFVGTEQGDIEKYHWFNLEKKYDFIIFADVLEHLVHPEEVLQKCKAMLKPDGRMFVSVPNISHNAIVIDLMNDRFVYHPTGILDNTHLKFFTRQSFEQFAANAGWAVVGERAKRIRVGELEITNSYSDVPREVARELKHRPEGDVYQYLFTLALSREYLTGQIERSVSMDSTSYYYMEVQFERQDKSFSYQNSITRHFDPYESAIKQEFELPENCERIILWPINTNAVLTDVSLEVSDSSGNRVKLDKMQANGCEIGGNLYCVGEKPQFEVCIPKGFQRITACYKIVNYDFDDKGYTQLIDAYYSVNQKCFDMQETQAKQLSDVEAGMDELRQALRHERANGEQNEEKINRLCQELSDLKERENETQKQFDQTIEDIKEGYEKEIARREQERQELLKGQGIVYRLKKTVTTKKKVNAAAVVNTIKQKWNPVIVKGPNEDTPRKAYEGPVRSVTAVIPNYNYANYLNERIDSVLYQTYPVQEVIILDDCSTDESEQLIMKRIQENHTSISMRYMRNEQNSGSVFAQWQKAFELAKGDYVWIAEADDSCDARFLEVVMQGFEDPEVVLYYC